MSEPSRGPLAGLRVLEMAAIGPVPFAAMMLADMGAEVVRVDRPGEIGTPLGERPHMGRGRSSIAVDLKHADGRELVLRMVERADVLIEGLRSGTMERLGLAPEDCEQRNPRLIYGRMTGWGQDGPLAHTAGHDINYISLSGVLGAIGAVDSPAVPLNLVGDFGGGAMLLLLGVLMALYERRSSGRGQVVDAAMVDGSSLLATLIHELAAEDRWLLGRRATNLLDGGAPFYRTYETADRRHVAVGALEPQFFAALIERLQLDFDPLEQEDRQSWPRLEGLLAATFKTRTRDEWEAVFAGTDACVSPVLSLDEVSSHEHIAARDGFLEVDGRSEPAPAPRFSRTPGRVEHDTHAVGADTLAVLARWSVLPSDLERMLASGALVQTSPAHQRGADRAKRKRDFPSG
jgi:alpha-methylacyl-CoA racemase